MNIQLESLSLARFDETKHVHVKDEFENGPSSSEFINEIAKRLELSKNNTKSIYQSAFIVESNDVPIGYLFISKMINDEIFLEYAVLKNFRRQGFGKKIIDEITAYLFEKHNIKSIRLDIDPSNKNSIFLADSCGYTADDEEYASRNFVGRIQFVKDNEYYISKRRK